MLGRHSNLSISQFVHSWSQAGSVAELAAARKEDKYSSIDGRYLFEPIAIDFRRVQHVGSPAPLKPWQKDFPVFRGSQRGELSLSEMLSAGAAFQHSFTVQQFAGL